MAALVLLNDPVFVEAARSFARRIIGWRQQFLEGETAVRGDAEAGDADHAAIAFAIEQAVSREAQSGEIEILYNLLESSRKHFEEQPALAEQFQGMNSSDAGGDGIEAVMLAAWSEVSRAILNLHETLTRE